MSDAYKVVELRWPTHVPDEFSRQFLQGMLDRMAVSYHKYGLMKDAAAAGVDMPASMRKRLALYEETGNTEWLMDCANVAMIEFTHPQHAEAHYRPTDSDESPGREMPPKRNTLGGETRMVPQRASHVHNRDLDTD